MKIEAEKNRYYGDVGWKSDKDLFVDVAVTWKQWLGSARKHLYTAEILLPLIVEEQHKIRELMENKEPGSLPPSLTVIYFFHCALAIENTMKSVISWKHNTDIKEKMKTSTKLPALFKSHVLIDLAKRADYEIGINKEYTLSFLTRYGIWGGKYPLPTMNEHNALTAKLSDGNHYLVGGYRPEIVPSFLKFCSNAYDWARLKVNKPYR
ncbi:hypothetical protein D1BOALGB6SA_10307 [Olavius sp. associated proteobacterium Delta 1]|nr:hypothetical protein D1BOALGB6SA_10307 [Olavius sp. associated proteobacterium Delta 1]